MEDSWRISRWKKDRSYFSPAKKSTIEDSYRQETLDLSVTPKTTEVSSASVLEVLHQAIESHDVNTLAEILISTNVPINMNEVLPQCSMTLLHLSVGLSDNNPQIVEALLDRGGDPNNTNIEEGLSPLQLSAIYDYDEVMKRLMDYGGDPKVKSGDGQNCYHFVLQNVEEMKENCFRYLFAKSRDFRKSMAIGLTQSTLNSFSNNRKQIMHDSGSDGDGFFSCESEHSSRAEEYQNIARRLFPNDYAYLMTEDESANDSSDEDDPRRKLTTIPEESGIGSLPPTTFHPTPPMYQGITSMTAPQCLLTDDSFSVMSDPSCVNSTPPITPQPTKEDLVKLQEQMKKLKLPVTPSTFSVISKFAESESRMQILLTPKTGTGNFSSELQIGIQNLALIDEWGKHKIDFLQRAVPTANTSKSFYNYLLLDPKVITRANFSGDSLKSGVINSGDKFEKFLHSVFYIGKAHGKRPLQHLVEAKARYIEMGRKSLKAGEKIDTILKIWKSGMGVIIVSVFHHSSEREANVNEACMIDAIGLVELSNLKKGSYAGTIASGWSQKTKNQMGSLLLYKSFCTFVVSDSKQFYPHDF